MALQEASRFRRAAGIPPVRVIDRILAEHRGTLNAGTWTHCGYFPIGQVTGVVSPGLDVAGSVDNAFRLGPQTGFESVPTMVTTGLRSSRFAPILFWEVLHALAPGGTWIDIDQDDRCSGTPLVARDFLDRDYFRTCLTPVSRVESDGLFTQVFAKTAASPVAAHIVDDGWTFGILTSGPSPQAARMATDILALDLPHVEIIFCGPRPAGVPNDSRVRSIDLDAPEPRGWITRKKNLLAEAASHERLCLLHDRYVVTPEWADALKACGPTAAIATFPHVYYADATRRFPHRYPDYQVLFQQNGLGAARRAHIYDADHVFHPSYEDFYETAFCCGGLYVATRSLWNMVRQDEALYHCEWEDISFGLDCQSRGIPHRVLTGLTVESTVPHPLLLTHRHDMSRPDEPARAAFHVRPEQTAAAKSESVPFKPLIGLTRTDYYGRVARRFHDLPMLREGDRLAERDITACERLSDFWRLIAARVSALPLRHRDDVAAVCGFVSDSVYKWPNSQTQCWIRDFEASRPHHLDDFATIVGWGSGSLFRASHTRLTRTLAYTLDNNPAVWGTVADGVDVVSPERLRREDPATTAIVVFSWAFDEIVSAIGRQGPFAAFRADAVTAERAFAPMTHLVAYFEGVERHYPALFQPGVSAGAR